ESEAVALGGCGKSHLPRRRRQQWVKATPLRRRPRFLAMPSRPRAECYLLKRRRNHAHMQMQWAYYFTGRCAMATHAMKGLTVAAACLAALWSLSAVAAEEASPTNRAAQQPPPVNRVWAAASEAEREHWRKTMAAT